MTESTKILLVRVDTYSPPSFFCLPLHPLFLLPSSFFLLPSSFFLLHFLLITFYSIPSRSLTPFVSGTNILFLPCICRQIAGTHRKLPYMVAIIRASFVPQKRIIASGSPFLAPAGLLVRVAKAPAGPELHY
jgi:hypothetical protein